MKSKKQTVPINFNTLTMKKIVDKNVLQLYDKYEGDFALLDDPWAAKEDRKIVTNFQCQILENYIELLQMVKVNNLSDDMKRQTIKKIKDLKFYIHEDVITILKAR